MTEAEIILFFSLWSGHLTELGGIYTDNLMKEVLRSLIWKLILWLRTVCISVERLYFKVFDVMDIASGEDVVLFSGGLRYYVVAVLSLSILSAGYRMMVSSSFDLKRAARNLVIAILVLSSSFSVIQSLTRLTRASVRGLESMESALGADMLISESIIDIAYRYEEGTLLPEDGNASRSFVWERNRNLSSTDIELLRINEKLSESLGEDTAPFDHTYRTDRNGKVIVEKFSDRNLGQDTVNWLRELTTDVPKYRLSYARYHVEFGTLLLSILALSAAYFLSTFRIFAVMFELTVSSVLLSFTAVSDLSSGERTKKVISAILGSLMTLFAMAVLFRLYTVLLIATFSLEVVRNHRILRTIAVLAYTYAMISGPGIIKILLGTDTGPSGETRFVFSTLRTASFAADTARGLASAAIGTGGRIIGFAGSSSPAKEKASSSGGKWKDVSGIFEKDEETESTRESSLSSGDTGLSEEERENLAYAGDSPGPAGSGEDTSSKVSLQDPTSQEMYQSGTDEYISSGSDTAGLQSDGYRHTSGDRPGDGIENRSDSYLYGSEDRRLPDPPGETDSSDGPDEARPEKKEGHNGRPKDRVVRSGRKENAKNDK